PKPDRATGPRPAIARCPFRTHRDREGSLPGSAIAGNRAPNGSGNGRQQAGRDDHGASWSFLRCAGHSARNTTAAPVTGTRRTPGATSFAALGNQRGARDRTVAAGRGKDFDPGDACGIGPAPYRNGILLPATRARTAAGRGSAARRFDRAYREHRLRVERSG